MSETLTIRNFGPIKDMTFDFKKVNVLIGDQGTGKSAVAKLLSVIKDTIFREGFDELGSVDREMKILINYLNFYGIESYLNKETELEFECDIIKLHLINQKLLYSKKIEYPRLRTQQFSYILAERNLVIPVAKAIYAILETGTKGFSKLFTRFADRFSNSKPANKLYNYKDILGVNFINKNGNDLIVLPDGKEILINDSSTGIQSCIPLLLVFDDLKNGDINDQEYFHLPNCLVIEEPELHCFPKTQNNIIKYLIENTKYTGLNFHDNYKNQLMINTHSPYILTSLNNLMYAYLVGQNNVEEIKELNKIVEKKYWLNPDDVSVYRLFDGYCENIMDEELKQIKVEKIDEISEILSGQWHELADLNFDK